MSSTNKGSTVGGLTQNLQQTLVTTSWTATGTSPARTSTPEQRAFYVMDAMGSPATTPTRRPSTGDLLAETQSAAATTPASTTEEASTGGSQLRRTGSRFL